MGCLMTRPTRVGLVYPFMHEPVTIKGLFKPVKKQTATPGRYIRRRDCSLEAKERHQIAGAPTMGGAAYPMGQLRLYQRHEVLNNVLEECECNIRMNP